LGFTRNEKPYLNNHLRIIIKYHTDDGETYRVVGFEVEPASVSNLKVTKDSKDCSLPDPLNLVPLEVTDSVKSIQYSYEVNWESSEVRWPSRWDTYLSMSDVQIHWFSIINSLVIILFLAAILTMIMIRTLRRDIAKYNQDEDVEESLEESGWKLVHGDVFRPPQHPRLLSAFIGSGVQLFLMLFITIFFAMLGMLSPASRGALMSMGIFSFVFMVLFAGYYSSRLYKTLRGQQWKTAALWTVVLVPGVVLGICFLLNIFIWVKHSSGAVPFTTMLALICMWLGISLPLGIVGAYFGFRKAPYQHPVRTNQIPRAVPPQKWYHSLPICVFVAGVLPFGALFIELFFIFTAIWERQFYYMFGFLFLVFLILVVSVSQISVVLTYFQLCAEDYHWWWRSFITSGGSAIYVMAYSVFYFCTKLEITDFVPTLLYFGYTSIMAFLLFVLTGSIGFYASYYFVTKIYGAIKID
jgi:transmembrane 9 superfamily member 2/4